MAITSTSVRLVAEAREAGALTNCAPGRPPGPARNPSIDARRHATAAPRLALAGWPGSGAGVTRSPSALPTRCSAANPKPTGLYDAPLGKRSGDLPSLGAAQANTVQQLIALTGLKRAERVRPRARRTRPISRLRAALTRQARAGTLDLLPFPCTETRNAPAMPPQSHPPTTNNNRTPSCWMWAAATAPPPATLQRHWAPRRWASTSAPSRCRTGAAVAIGE